MEDYKTWAVGDEVECVDNEYFEDVLTNGKKYKIRRLQITKGYYKGIVEESLSIFIYGVSDEVGYTSEGRRRNAGMNAKRFRKLQKRKTDISQFQAMLNQTSLIDS